MSSGGAERLGAFISDGMGGKLGEDGAARNLEQADSTRICAPSIGLSFAGSHHQTGLARRATRAEILAPIAN